MAVELPTDWLAAESMVTLAGASAAVVAIANTLWKVFKFNPMVVGLIASGVITAYGAILGGTLGTWGGFLTAIVNGCVLFSMAFGIDESLSSFAGIRVDPSFEASASTRPWLVPWIR